MSELQQKIEGIILPFIEDKGFELVELKLTGNNRNRIVQIFVWKDGGINVGECAKLSEGISEILDMEEILQIRYFLEVSSPGLDRPLKTLKDFKRNIGEKIELFTIEDNSKIGTITAVSIDSVSLENDGVITNYTWDKITWGKIIVEFK